MNSNSRTSYAAKNFIWATVGNCVNTILSFISRTIFIYILGTKYLGVSGLFTNILGVLSLAELGVGSAIGFTLYKPLAEDDTKKIKAIVNFYGTAYKYIALVIAVIGVSLIPFLNFIIKDGKGIEHIPLIYCLYLFNTVSSYLLTYRTTVLSANQKDYIITNINTIVKLITVFIQILVLIICKNYMVYLIVDMGIQLISKLYINNYVNKVYPYLKKKNEEKLTKEEKSTIYKKVGALVFHKIGEVSINQTDNIITSVFISIESVGIVSNFTMIISIVNQFVSSFFNAAVAGLGNVIVVEKPKKRLEIFENYDFLAFCFFGWSSICLYFLLEPFVSLWIGADKVVDHVTVSLLCINYFLTGMRIPLGNMKMAAGAYEQDQWAPIAQAVINLGASIIGVQAWGLKGVYVGTLISSMVPNIVRPYIVYKYVFEQNCWRYFLRYLKRIGLLLMIVFLMTKGFDILTTNNNMVVFIFKMIGCTFIPILILYFWYKDSKEMEYIIQIIKQIFRRGKR